MPKKGQINAKRKGIPLVNVSKKDPLKIIRDFEKLPYKNYESRSPKHEPTDSYFCLSG